MAETWHGYVTDIPYLRDFKPMQAPAWLDHVALVCGVEPPDRSNGFSWCDLGCGQGVTAVVLAATHPAGRFHAIDAMPAHIGHARRLAAEAGVANAAFEAADFAAAAERDYPLFDYIVAHGVYSWVNEASQAALRRFIDRHLKPGGLVYVSYDAMPGWAPDLPFQHLLRALADTFAGDSGRRAAAAAGLIASLAKSGMAGVASSRTLAELRERPTDYPAAYLAHEFLHRGWRPLYVTEMRAAMRTIGLAPVGSATLIENDDALAQSEPARAALGRIADEDLRELVRDFFLDQRLRCDVFDRGNRRLGAAERERGLLGRSFALARPAAAIEFAADTPAGRLDCKNRPARMVVAALSAGPRRLGEIAGQSESRLVAAMLLLCAVGDAMPVEPGAADVGSLNRALLRRVDGPEPIAWLALPCGTAIAPAAGLLRRLRDRGPIGARAFPGWPDFLAAHGIELGRGGQGVPRKARQRPAISAGASARE